MWDFLTKLLDHSGTIAVFYSVSMGAAGLAIRAMWNHNQKLHSQLSDANTAKDEAVKKATEDYAARVALIEVSHGVRVDTLHKRIDELQEKRVRETRETTEKVVGHIGHIDATMDKLGTAVDVLIDLSGRR